MLCGSVRLIRAEDLHVFSAKSFRSLDHVEFDLVTFLETFTKLKSLDIAAVDEDIFRSIIGGNETKALLDAEPLYFSLSHKFVNAADLLFPKDKLYGKPDGYALSCFVRC